MSTQGLIEKRWRAFSTKILPANAGPVQRSEMGKAFKAGLAEMFYILTREVGAMETEKAAAALGKLEAEIESWITTMGDVN